MLKLPFAVIDFRGIRQIFMQAWYCLWKSNTPPQADGVFDPRDIRQGPSDFGSLSAGINRLKKIAAQAAEKRRYNG